MANSCTMPSLSLAFVCLFALTELTSRTPQYAFITTVDPVSAPCAGDNSRRGLVEPAGSAPASSQPIPRPVSLHPEGFAVVSMVYLAHMARLVNHNVSTQKKGGPQATPPFVSSTPGAVIVAFLLPPFA